MLVLLLLINCSLNPVKTPRKVCANSPFTKGKKHQQPNKQKDTLRGASKLHRRRQQTNGSLLPGPGKQGENSRLCRSSGDLWGLAAVLQLQNCCHGRETWNVTSSEGNTCRGCCLNAAKVFCSSLSVCRARAVCASHPPCGTNRCLQICKDIWALLSGVSGAHRLTRQRAKVTLRTGSKTYSAEFIRRICGFYVPKGSDPRFLPLFLDIRFLDDSSQWGIFVSLSVFKPNRIKCNCCTSDDLRNPGSLLLPNFRHVGDELLPGALLGWLQSYGSELCTAPLPTCDILIWILSR